MKSEDPVGLRPMRGQNRIRKSSEIILTISLDMGHRPCDHLLMTTPTYDTTLFRANLNTLSTEASTIGLRGDEQTIALRSHKTGAVKEFAFVAVGRNGNEVTHWHYRSVERIQGGFVSVIVYND